MTAVEWLMTKLQSLGVTKEEHYELLCQLELEAKVMEKEQSLKMPPYDLDELARNLYNKSLNYHLQHQSDYTWGVIDGFQKALELLTFKSRLDDPIQD